MLQQSRCAKLTFLTNKQKHLIHKMNMKDSMKHLPAGLAGKEKQIGSVCWSLICSHTDQLSPAWSPTDCDIILLFLLQLLSDIWTC